MARLIQRQSGFTLLEILIAAAILAMVMTLSYGVFRWIQDASARITEGRPRDRAVRVVLDRVERELSGAILMRRVQGVDPLTEPWVFYAEDRVIENQDADRVRFVTQTPLRAAGERYGRGIRIVSYGLEVNTDGIPVLLRQEEAMPEQLEKAIDFSEAQIVAEDVATFSLRYQGESGMRDTWDSTSVENDNLLPFHVEVTVQLWEHNAGGERVAGWPVTRLMEIPTRPEYLQSSGNVRRPDTCETGISTSQCRDAWMPVIQGTLTERPEDPVIFQRLFDSVPDACWNVEDPTSARQELQKQLEMFLRLHPEASVTGCPPQP